MFVVANNDVEYHTIQVLQIEYNKKTDSYITYVVDEDTGEILTLYRELGKVGDRFIYPYKSGEELLELV